MTAEVGLENSPCCSYSIVHAQIQLYLDIYLVSSNHFNVFTCAFAGQIKTRQTVLRFCYETRASIGLWCIMNVSHRA